MYQRFSDRARKVFQLANQTALSWGHEYLGTEHLLVGMCKEGHGVAANVLKNLGCDGFKLGVEVSRHVKINPDMVVMGKLPQTPQAKKVVEYAIEEAGKLQHNYIGTEHLLLGLLRVEGLHVKVLTSMGVSLEDVRKEIEALVGPEVEIKVEASSKHSTDNLTIHVGAAWQLTDAYRLFNLIVAVAKTLVPEAWDEDRNDFRRTEGTDTAKGGPDTPAGPAQGNP